MNIYIENDYYSRRVKIWAINNGNQFDTNFNYVDGNVVGNDYSPDGITPLDIKPFLELPFDLFKALSESMAKYIEKDGGIQSEQLFKGKIERFDSEVTFLRELVKTAMNK